MNFKLEYSEFWLSHLNKDRKVHYALSCDNSRRETMQKGNCSEERNYYFTVCLGMEYWELCDALVNFDL